MTNETERENDAVCWIAWERHQRSLSLTRELNIPFIEMDRGGGRLIRYVANSFATLRVLLSKRYRTVYVQAPSVVLPHLVMLMSVLLRFRVVVDAHNAIIEGAEHASQPLRFLYRWVVRHADILIVTNSAVAARVRALGGRPGILPDPVPAFRGRSKSQTIVPTAVVISTWAPDEPMAQIIRSAAAVTPELSLTITGRPRGRFADLARESDRIRLSGFVSEQDYVDLLRTARVIVDLTTRKDCLVCGAYEALAVGRPLVVSDSEALRELLREGALYSKNDPQSIASAINLASASHTQWADRCAARRESYIVEWKQAANALLEQVRALAN